VAELDWSVGQVLKAVADAGLDTNTLVVFTSDNGPWYEGTAGSLRGRKGETWDGGMRVPFIARFPGQLKVGDVAGRASGLDLLPTFARLANAPLPQNPVDGVDIWPLLTGEKDIVEHPPFFYFDNDNLQAVRIRNWKLHVARGNEFPWVDRAEGRMNLPLINPELYNLNADPTESANMAQERPQIVAMLQDAIARALPTFPQQIQDAWNYTRGLKVIETPSGALPHLAAVPKT
jgi:arylsulfatase A-like enzyme